MAKKIENLQPITPPNPENLTPDELRELIDKADRDGQVIEQAEPEPVKEEVLVEEEETASTESQEEVKEEQAEEPPATEEEALILGKFKNQEDLIKAYEEIEKKATKEAQLRSHYQENLAPYVDFDEGGNVLGLKQNINISSQQQQEPQQYQPQGQASDPLAQWENYYNALEAQHGPVKAQIMFNYQLNQSMMKNALTPLDTLKADREIERQKRDLRNSGIDYTPFESDIDAILNRMDSKSKLNPQAVRTVLNLVKGQKYDEILRQQEERKKQSEEEAQAKTAVIEEQKVKAQVSHPTKTPEEPNFDIDNASADELKKHLGLKRTYRY